MENSQPQIQPSDLIDAGATFPEPVMEAVKSLARSKPWQGTWDERFGKLKGCATALYAAYDAQPWTVVHVGDTHGYSAASRLRPNLRRIELRGRLSVVTLLWLFHGSIGIDGLTSYRLAVTLFAKCFPRSFAHCTIRGGILINEGRIDE